MTWPYWLWRRSVGHSQYGLQQPHRLHPGGPTPSSAWAGNFKHMQDPLSPQLVTCEQPGWDCSHPTSVALHGGVYSYGLPLLSMETGRNCQRVICHTSVMGWMLWLGFWRQLFLSTGYDGSLDTYLQPDSQFWDKWEEIHPIYLSAVAGTDLS